MSAKQELFYPKQTHGTRTINTSDKTTTPRSNRFRRIRGANLRANTVSRSHCASELSLSATRRRRTALPPGRTAAARAPPRCRAPALLPHERSFLQHLFEHRIIYATRHHDMFYRHASHIAIEVERWNSTSLLLLLPTRARYGERIQRHDAPSISTVKFRRGESSQERPFNAS